MLTDRELALVSRAQKTIARVKLSRIVMLVILGAGFAAMIYDFLSPDNFAYFTVAMVVYAMLLPQLGGPRYEELVELLIKVRSKAEEKEVDPVIDVLARKP